MAGLFHVAMYAGYAIIDLYVNVNSTRKETS